MEKAAFEDMAFKSPTYAELEAEINRLNVENDRLRRKIETYGDYTTCRLVGVTDATFRVYADDERQPEDFATVAECSACGSMVLVPPEYTRIYGFGDELWPEYKCCPVCMTALEAGL